MAIWLPDLSRRSGPKYLQIVEALAEDIAAGRLAVRTRLPPHRELAYQLGISPNTTSRAYAEAVKRALIQGEVGRGTFVRATDGPVRGTDPETLHRKETGPIDLSRNLPMPGFAEPHIRQVMSEIAVDTGMQALLDYQTDRDLWPHRDAGRSWLAGCGLECKIEDVIPVVGGQHGIFSVLMALLHPGDLLLVEKLTYTPVLAMAERLNLRSGSVAMDDLGVIPDAFEMWCKEANPRAFYLTPTLQAPTTVTLSAERRTQIADVAERYGVVLIEDDVFGPLKQDKPAPIAALAPQRTVYVSSLSKTVAPGLRAGFLRAPSKLASALHQSVNLSVWMTPPVTLEISRRMIENGVAAKLTGQQRRAAAERQDLAHSIIRRAAIPQKPDGFHVWIPLPEGWRADAFVAECSRNGVLVSEGRSFAVDAMGAPEAIRLCVSHEPNLTRLQNGLEIVGNLLDQKPNGVWVAI